MRSLQFWSWANAFFPLGSVLFVLARRFTQVQSFQTSELDIPMIAMALSPALRARQELVSWY